MDLDLAGLAAGEDRGLFERGLAAITEAQSLHAGNLQRAAKLLTTSIARGSL